MRVATWLLSRCTLLLRNTPLAGSAFLNRLQLRILGLVYRTDLVEVHGMKLRIHSPPDHIAKKLILGRDYEAEVTAALESLVGEGDVVMDVGANLGYHTVALSRLVGPDGHVVAVEPDPDNLRLLRENLRLNGCENVTVVACALGAAASTAKLSICPHNRGYQGLVDLARSRTFIEVRVRRADEVLERRQPSLVKIDVEGGEPQVLAGFSPKPPRIIFEFSTPQLRAFGQDPLRFLRGLIAEGYTLSRIQSGGILPVDPEDITALADRTRLDYNLLAVRDAV
jgi:FkbM family methyltransferase